MYSDGPIKELGLSRASFETIKDRAILSAAKLESLSSNLNKAPNIPTKKNLSIYAAGSYGRLEASKHSDIDLFFVAKKVNDNSTISNIDQIKMFSSVISVGDGLEFPAFSNDGEYLKLIYIDEMIDGLGGRSDDYLNHFTARMLLLLEGRPLFGTTEFENAKNEIIDAYFKDYPKHNHQFQPMFLLNDISRFWLTLCLNYENKRNKTDETKKIKQKVRNYKLKYSRKLTCYATILAIMSNDVPVTKDIIAHITNLTPIERIAYAAKKKPPLKSLCRKIINSYVGFLNNTSLTTEELEKKFIESMSTSSLFLAADEFSVHIYNAITYLKKEHPKYRPLVV